MPPKEPAPSHGSSLPSAAVPRDSSFSGLRRPARPASGEGPRQQPVAAPPAIQTAANQAVGSPNSTQEPPLQRPVRRQDYRIPRDVWNPVNRLMPVLQEKVGWEVNSTELVTALMMILSQSQPVIDRQPTPIPTTRPPTQDLQARMIAERKLAVFLHQVIRDAEALK